MGIDDAVRAAEFLQPKAVVPTHYNAFDPIRKDPDEYAEKLAAIGIKCTVIPPGEEESF